MKFRFWKQFLFFLKMLFVSIIALFITLYIFGSVYGNENSGTLVTDEMSCNCSSRKLNVSVKPSVMSNCDGYATSRGDHQMVVSFSFYGDIGSPYFSGISRNAELVLQYYPNWLMRVYHSLDFKKNEKVRLALCALWCKYSHLDFCPIQNVSKSQNKHIPKIWRFYPLGDPLVERFVVRDIDSLITEREMAAVGQWLVSGKTWHFMHDHPYHSVPIMGGLWGGLNRNLTLSKDILERVIVASQNSSMTQNDQFWLEMVLLPIVEKSRDYMNHHSFHCRNGAMKMFTPFPVQRLNRSDFVGSPILRYDFPVSKVCNEECRPRNHQNWTLC